MESSRTEITEYADSEAAAHPPASDAVAALLPDGRPEPRLWRRAWHDVVAERKARVTTAGLGWLLTSLASARIPSLHILEVGAEHVRLSNVAYGADGPGPQVRHLAGTGPAESPSPAGRLARLFLLAGGTTALAAGAPTGGAPFRPADAGGPGSQDGAGPGNADASTDPTAALGRRLDLLLRQAGPRTGPLLLVVRAAGWPLVERAADTLRSGDAPVVRLRLPARWPAAPDDLLSGLPLRHPVWLAGAHVDGSCGTVALMRTVLFPAGSRPAGPTGTRTAPGADVRVPVTAPPGGNPAGQPLAAVVSARRDEPASHWRTLRTDRLELAPRARATLRYRLVGPGRVELHYDGPHTSDASDWASLALQTPRRLSRPRPVDLVLAVEIAGPQADGGVAVEERLQEAAAVVAAVRDAVGEEDSLRVGLIGYRDHAPLDRPHHSDPLVHRVALSPPRAAEQVLGGWHRSVLRHDFATGLEHVPQELSAWRDAWRPDSHRVLLTVGSRPPHPRSRPPQVLRRGAAVRICPDRLEWEAALRSVRHDDGVTCLAVIDEPTWMDRLAGEPHLARWADRAWDLFGAEGRFAAGHDPRSIASAVTAPALGRPEDGTPIRLVACDGAGGDWLPAAAG
ncbi:hypothetical protein ACGFS9_08770 [Streptomyces sp. NPDC048566]|uniref:hypothetical protein n=1 Tax=Streptomyces sp. NPDC048566 TaxID=3365569 RepID=UPI0037199FD0